MCLLLLCLSVLLQWNEIEWELCFCHKWFRVEVNPPNKNVWEISRHIRLDTWKKTKCEMGTRYNTECGFIKTSERAKQWEYHIKSWTLARNGENIDGITKEVSEERNRPVQKNELFSHK